MSATIRLDNMVDKTFYYRKQPAVLKNWSLNINNHYELIIEINGIPQKFVKTDDEKLDLFLSNFSEVQEASIMPVNQAAEIYEENKQTFAKLSDILISDIDKVRNDPGYVNQAKQVCNTVNTLVNMTKLQLQLSKQQ